MLYLSLSYLHQLSFLCDFGDHLLYSSSLSSLAPGNLPSPLRDLTMIMINFFSHCFSLTLQFLFNSPSPYLYKLSHSTNSQLHFITPSCFQNYNHLDASLAGEVRNNHDHLWNTASVC